MKHFIFIPLIIGIACLGIFLPYLPGDYDYFAVGISSLLQFAIGASLLLVPVGLAWVVVDQVRRNAASTHQVYFRRTVRVLLSITVAAAALGAFAANSRFAAIIILASGTCYLIYWLMKKSTTVPSSNSRSAIPYYLILIPTIVFAIRISFLEKAKNRAIIFVIHQSETYIQAIEIYKANNGHYPVSLQSTIEDYKPSISGISRFHYELNGEAYNLYFEPYSNVIGTQEIVMYNKLDEHEMTTHNMDLLTIAPQNISRGYHATAKLAFPHWKVFYFD